MRLFFALWPPEHVAAALAAEADALARKFGGKPTRQETVARALSEAAGKPLRFEAVLDGDGGASQGNDLREENVRTLASAVGRDLLQVDDGNSRQT